MNDKFLSAYKSHQLWVTSKGQVGKKLVMSTGQKPNYFTNDNRWIYVEGLVNKSELVNELDADGMILPDMNFESADFSGYHFKEIDLSGVSFNKALLIGAKFFKCKIEKSSFDEANMPRVVFDSCEILNCSFISSRLNGSEITNSQLKDCAIENAEIDHSKINSTEISSNKISNSNLTNSVIKNSLLVKNVFNRSNFSKIIGREVHFVGCGLVEQKFDKCELYDFLFETSSGVGISWVDSKLYAGKFDNCRFSAADMSGGSYENLIYSDCDLSYSNWIDKIWYEQIYNHEKKKWINERFNNPISMDDVKFIRSTLSEIRVQNIVLSEVMKSKCSSKFRGTFTVVDKEKPALHYKVFICHAHENETTARDIFDCLCKEPDMDPWLDKVSLLPGQYWEKEIPKAIRNSDVVLVLLSEKLMFKRGYVQREVKLALDVLNEIPDGEIFIVPIKLDACEVTDQLRRFQWIDYKEVKNIGDVLRAIRSKKPLMSIKNSIKK